MADNELELVIKGNSDQFTKALDDSTKSLGSLTKQISLLTKTFSDSLGSVTGQVKKLDKEFDPIFGTFKNVGQSADEFKKKASNISTEYKKSFIDIEKAGQNLANTLAFGFAGLLFTAKQSITEFGNFQAQMLNVRNNLNEASFAGKTLDQGFKDLTKTVLELGAKTPVQLGSIADGLFDIVSAGIPADKAVVALAQGLKLAVAGAADPKVAIDSLTTAINAYGLSLEQLAPVTAKFFQAQLFGKLSVEELAGTIGQVASISASAKVSLDEMLGIIATLSLTSGSASEAGTKLQGIIRALIKPSQEATEEAKRLGIAFGAQALEEKGIIPILESIRKANNLTGDSIAKLFGRVEAITGASALLGQQFKQAKQIIKDVSNETAALNAITAAEKQNMESVNSQLTLLANSFKILSINVVGSFLPQIKSLTELFTNLRNSFDITSEDSSKLTASFIKMTAAATGTAAALRGVALILGLSVGGWPIVAAAGVTALSVAVSDLNPTLDETTKKLKEQADTQLNILGIQKRFIEQQISIKRESEDYETSQGFIDDNANLSSINREMKVYIDQLKEIQTTGEVTPRFPSPTIAPLADMPAEQAPLITESQVDDTLSLLDQYEAQRTIKAQAGADSRLVVEDGFNAELLNKKKALTEEELNLEAYRNQQQIENQKIAFEEKLLLVEDSYNKQLISEQEYQAQIQAIQEDAARQKINIRKGEVLTEKQLQAQAIRERTAARNKENLQIYKDTENSNATIAKLNAFNRSSEFKASQDALGNLASLTQSKNKELFAIGKAASISQAIINTYVGATRALAEVPPPFGAILAGTVIAAGFVQVDNIRRQQFQGAEDGMVVEGGSKFRDSVPTLLTQGEIVVPRRNYQDVIAGATAARMAKETQLKESNQVQNLEEIPVNVTIGFNQNAFDLIEAEIVERRTLRTARI